ncbi:unnamed protein product [Owenia fusiformis]|uniref:G-protein coupled receptors family 1 profile domain-containing protein n=1 Tax=Owenia fusiformis TaxID=6347 RepID=A0A8S4NY86_OWEFU|nr:unnamed protein product [Owenia fusiformis]
MSILYGSPDLQEILKMSEMIGKKIMPAILTLIIIFGVLGNLLVICVILRDKFMRNGSYLMFLNLAMADMLYLAICLPASISESVRSRWILGETMCKIVHFTVDVSVYVSIYTLVLICLARFLAVAFPVQFSSSQTLSCSITACAVVWIVMLAANIQVLIRAKLQPIRPDLPNSDEVHCFKTNSDDETKKVVLHFFIFAYALPLVFITVLNGIIFLHLQSAATGDYLSLATRKRRKRFRQLVILVIIGFAVCWGPINIMGMIQTHGSVHMSRVWTILNTVSNCMAYANSMINPIFYNIGSSDFRRAFKDLVQKCRSCGCESSTESNVLVVVATVNKDKARSSSDNPSDLGMASSSVPSRVSMPTLSSTSV